MASHLLAAAIRIHHLNPVTAPPLRFVESPWLGSLEDFNDKSGDLSESS